MNLAGHGVNALKLRLEDVVQVVSNCLEGIGHDGVRLGQDLLGDAAASFGTGLLRLHGSTLVSKDAVASSPTAMATPPTFATFPIVFAVLTASQGLNFLPKACPTLSTTW